MNRGEMTLADVQCHLDKEGASNLVIDLIMNATSDRVFHESILLAIALLEGGNTTIQHSFFCRLTEDKKSEKFFKVFYDRMKVAQQEIKATVTVNTSDLGNKKKDEDSDRDVPVRKRVREPTTQITEEVRDQLLEASAVTRKAYNTYRREADADDHYSAVDGVQNAADKNKDDLEMSAVITIMQPSSASYNYSVKITTGICRTSYAVKTIKLTITWCVRHCSFWIVSVEAQLEDLDFLVCI